MTDNEINIAIAKACGWWGIEQEGMMRPPLSTSEYKMVPDYCHDLNAMHEVENGLDYFDGTRGDYLAALTTIVAKANDEVPPSKSRGIHRATARQRAQAFLRVKGLWK